MIPFSINIALTVLKGINTVYLVRLVIWVTISQLFKIYEAFGSTNRHKVGNETREVYRNLVD